MKKDKNKMFQKDKRNVKTIKKQEQKTLKYGTKYLY